MHLQGTYPINRQGGRYQGLAAMLEEARQSEFRTLVQAIECTNNRYIKGKDHWIVEGVYWVVQPKVAQCLVNAGYELAYGY